MSELFEQWWHSLWVGSPWFMAGQVMGLILIGLNMTVLFPKRRQTILKLKMTCDVLNTVQYGLIGAVTGALISLVCVGREFVFLKRETKKWADLPIWIPVFLGFVWAVPVCQVLALDESPFVFLPAIGSTFTVIGYYQKQPIRIKWLGLISIFPWFVYGVIVRNFGVVLCQILIFVSTVAAIIKWYVHDRKSIATDPGAHDSQ